MTDYFEKAEKQAEIIRIAKIYESFAHRQKHSLLCRPRYLQAYFQVKHKQACNGFTCYKPQTIDITGFFLLFFPFSRP